MEESRGTRKRRGASILDPKESKKKKTTKEDDGVSSDQVRMTTIGRDSAEKIEIGSLVTSLSDTILTQWGLQAQLTALNNMSKGEPCQTWIEHLLHRFDPEYDPNKKEIQQILDLVTKLDEANFAYIERDEVLRRLDRDRAAATYEEAPQPRPFSAYMEPTGLALIDGNDRMVRSAIHNMQQVVLNCTKEGGRDSEINNANRMEKEFNDQVNFLRGLAPDLPEGTMPDIIFVRSLVNEIRTLAPHLREMFSYMEQPIKRNALKTVNGHLEIVGKHRDMGQPISRNHFIEMLKPPVGNLKPCRAAIGEESLCCMQKAVGAANSQEIPQKTVAELFQAYRTPEEVASGKIPTEDRFCIMCILHHAQRVYNTWSQSSLPAMITINCFTVEIGTGPNQFDKSYLLGEYDGPSNRRRTGIDGNWLSFEKVRPMLFQEKEGNMTVWKLILPMQDF
jgi:hypothetical protein